MGEHAKTDVWGGWFKKSESVWIGDLAWRQAGRSEFRRFGLVRMPKRWEPAATPGRGKWWVSKVPANELPNFEKQLFKHIQTYSNINKPTIGFGVWGISGLCLIRGRVGLGWLRDIKGINWNCAHDSYSISAGRGSSSSTDSRKMAWISTCTYTVTT